mgnify:CR=1 FL=1
MQIGEIPCIKSFYAIIHLESDALIDNNPILPSCPVFRNRHRLRRRALAGVNWYPTFK